MEYALHKGNSYVGKQDGGYKIVSQPEKRVLFHSIEEANKCKEKMKQQGKAMKGWEVVCIPNPNMDVTGIIQNDTYVITNGKSFVGMNKKGKKVSFSANLNMVSIFSSAGEAQEALELLQGQHPNAPKYKVAPFKDAFASIDIKKQMGGMMDEDDSGDVQEPEEMRIRRSELYHDGKMHIMAERCVCSEIDKAMEDFEDSITGKYEEYTKELSRIEKFLVDAYHLFEFSEFEEGDGRVFKLYTLLQQILRKRRDLKDGIEKINRMEKIRSDMKQLKDSFRTMDARTYVPRAVEELFVEMETGGITINPSAQDVQDKKAKADEEAAQHAQDGTPPDTATNADRDTPDGGGAGGIQGTGMGNMQGLPGQCAYKAYRQWACLQRPANWKPQ